MANPFYPQRGNAFFMILIGVVLFAAVSLSVVGTMRGGKNISDEKARLLAGQIVRYGGQVKSAVDTLYRSGVSENAIRFAHPKLAGDYGTITTTPENQVFSETGGGMPYAAPPEEATTTPVTWEFFGNSDIPRVGTGEADLTIVLPNVKEAVCRQINVLAGYAATDAIPTDSASDCVYSSTASDRFAGTFKTGGAINSVGTTGFTVLPAYQACVSCGGTYHFYSVLIER